jgi:zinc transporter ZupT
LAASIADLRWRFENGSHYTPDMIVPLLLGVAAVAATGLGGLFALRAQDKLHLILGFSAGAVMGVALFDLLPEAIELTSDHHDVSTITAIVAAGFFVFMLLSRVFLLHPSADGGHAHAHAGQSSLQAASLAVHSFLDGFGMGLAFKVSTAVGAIVATAVLAHDFSDGINTVSVVLRDKERSHRAIRWLSVDAIAPLLGVASTSFVRLSSAQLGTVLALFCGFFLYIGASDLLPESHHRHPKALTGLMNVLGAFVIYFAIRLAE